jgi:hypothetical protein
MPDVAVRTTPRISINKLGEYLVASPRRRRRILLDQKYPQTIVTARYREAEEAIIDFLVGKGEDDRILENAIRRIELGEARTDWEDTNQRICVEALTNFLDLADDLDLTHAARIWTEDAVDTLVLSGVSISVRPTVFIQGRNAVGDPAVGAIKVHFSKSSPFTRESGAYVAGGLRHYLFTTRPGGPPAARALCIAIDVSSRRVYTAPRAYKQRLGDVEVGCEEISRGWAAL